MYKRKDGIRKDRKRKRIGLTAIICIGAICAILGAAYIYRIRGSVKAIPTENIEGTEPVFYRQKDERWASRHLGNSKFTMESSGCLVTCIASAMEMSDDRTRTKEVPWGQNPGELNQYFTEKQIYDSQGNIQWNPLREIEGFEADVLSEVSAEILLNYLEQGKYPIVRVRVSGLLNFHYVLITSSRDGMFYCMDPLNEKEEEVPLSHYGNRVYAIRCIYPE